MKAPSRAPRPSPLIPLLWRLGATRWWWKVWMPNGKSLTGSGAPEAYVVPSVERYMDLKLMDFAFN